MHNILFYTGVFFLIIYLAQFVMGMLGMDHDVEIDHDSGHGEFQALTVKNVVAFFVGFCWGTLSAMEEFGNGVFVSIILGIIAGGLMIGMNFFVMWLIAKLSDNRTPSLNSAIGQTATVYLRIPLGSIGKVTVDVDGTSKVLSAVCLTETIPTGEKVKVVALSGDDLVVEKLKN